MLRAIFRKLDLDTRAEGMNYRSKRKHTSGDIDANTLAEVIIKAGGECEWCGRTLDAPEDAIEIDHILPFRLGGSSDPENLALSCADCNRRKSDKHPARFAHEQAAAGISTRLIAAVLTRYGEQSAIQRALFD